jgi:hypothetical protein
LVYVTAATAANFGGVSGADALCESGKPSAGTWKALISDGVSRLACTGADCTNDTTGRMNWVLAADTMYRRSSDNALVGTTNSPGLFAFPLTNGWASNTNRSWTGFQASWSSNTNNCSAWTNATSSFDGKAGINNATKSTSIATGGVQDCDSSNTLGIICFQQ